MRKDVAPKSPCAPGASSTTSSADSMFYVSPAGESAIARMNRKQHGPPFTEITMEIPVSSFVFLETTIVAPQLEGGLPPPHRVAILLHPWSRLGGNFNDRVLLSLVTPFLKLRYHVILYNARGVGHSGGSPSWTGLTEACDLQKVVHLALKEMQPVEEIVLVGYSYGSLAVSMHPPTIAPEPGQEDWINPNLTIRHLIISYPLSVMWALTCFHSTSYSNALSSLVSDPHSDIMIVYGDRDQFTALAKYEPWVARLRGLVSGSDAPRTRGDMTIHRVAGADHFWSGPSLRELRHTVTAWITAGPPSPLLHKHRSSPSPSRMIPAS